jgi:tetratricopeptide (TPR) repeat protein
MAKVRKDRLYSLSVLVEAHRLDNSLNDLIERFGRAENLSPESRQTWIDLLRETQQQGKALSLIKQNGAGIFSPEERRQLIRLYQEAGQASEVVLEYNKLIARESGEVSWPRGLSEHYMGVGEAALAEQVWRNFLNANIGDAAVLLKGFQAMARMGFDALIAKALEGSDLALTNAAPILFFQFELHLERGRTTDAEEILTRIEDRLSMEAGVLARLAEAYERLDQPEKALGLWETLSRTEEGLSYDQKLRLAWLFGKLGKHEQALDAWMVLWRETTLKARQSYVEGQVLSAAAEVGRIGDIVVELEEKLAEGNADQSDSSLLVRLYTKVGDQISAVDVIEEFFSRGDGGEVKALMEQAKVYLLLGDHESYRRINRRLIGIDPENAADYLRGNILSRIERSGDNENNEGRVTEVRRLLDELQQLGDGSVGGEFEGAILMQAGLLDEAVESYRRAAANSPENSDIYLLLGDLLRKMDRKSEAIAMFQYLAEAAVEDSQFVVAIDGLINMVAASTDGGMMNLGGAQDPEKARLLGWMRRIILERLTAGADKTYLYNLLADVAEEERDVAGQIAALENSIPLAGDQRSATLRQLVILTSPTTNPFGMGAPRSADRAGQYLDFGRRLVALREALPPEIYIDLGKAFLDRGEAAEAARAFNMASDITGRRNIKEQAAELFDEAGYERQALDQYASALINNSGDVPLTVKYAGLRERLGQDAAANSLYAEALRILLLKQPLTVQTTRKSAQPSMGFGGMQANGNVTREFNAHYAGLVSGFLRTWSGKSGTGASELEWLGIMLDAEMLRVVSSADYRQEDRQPLEFYVRLDYMGRLARRVAISTGRYDYADQMDTELLGRFGHDGVFITSLVSDRLEWGLKESAAKLARKANKLGKKSRVRLQALLRSGDANSLSALEEALATADSGESFARAFSIAVLMQDEGAVLKVARAWAKFGLFSGAMDRSKPHLSKRNYANLARYILRLIRQDLDSLKNNPGRVLAILAEIEELTGEQVYTQHQILEFYMDINLASQTFMGTGALVERLSSKNVLELLRYISANKKSFELGQALSVLLGPVLGSPVDPEYVDRIADVVIEVAKKADAYMGRSVIGNMLPMTFMQMELPAENADLARRIVSSVQKTSLHKTDLEPLFLLREGNTDAAIDAFIEAHRQSDQGANSPPGAPGQMMSMGGMMTRSNFLPKYRDIIRAKLVAMATEQGWSPELTGSTYGLLYSGLPEDQIDQEELQVFLENATGRAPDNRVYLKRLYAVYSGGGNFEKAVGVLGKLRALDPENPGYTDALYAAWTKLDMPSEALRLQSENSRDLRASVASGKILAEAGLSVIGSPQGQQQGMPPGGGPVGGPAGISFGGPGGPGEVATDPNITVIVEAAGADDQEALKIALRKFWLQEPAQAVSGQLFMMVGGSSSGAQQRHRQRLDTDWPSVVLGADEKSADPTEFERVTMSEKESEPAQKLFDVLADHAFSAAEFERFLRAMDRKEANELVALYGYLAKAYQRQGVADQKLQALSRVISKDMASYHDITLWLTLLSDHSGDLPAGTLKVLERKSSDRAHLSTHQLILMAGILAKTGRQDKSAEIYSLLAAKMVLDPAGGSGTLWQLVEEIDRSLTGEHRGKALENIFNIAKPTSDGAKQVYREFVIRASREVMSLQGASAMVGKFLEIPDDDWAVKNLISLADLQVRTGNSEQAMNALKLSLRKNRPDKAFGTMMTMMRPGMSMNVSTRSGASVLGTPAAKVTSEDPADLGGDLFPGPDSGWPSAEKWLLDVVASLQEWIDAEGFEGDKTLRLMSLIAYRLHEAENSDVAEGLMDEISAHLSGGVVYAPQAIALALEVAEQIGSPLSLEAMQALLRAGRLEASRIGSVVERTYRAEGAAKAFALGEGAAKYTNHPALLAALISVAEEAGDDARAEYWRQARKDAAEARRKLLLEAA